MKQISFYNPEEVIDFSSEDTTLYSIVKDIEKGRISVSYDRVDSMPRNYEEILERIAQGYPTPFMAGLENVDGTKKLIVNVEFFVLKAFYKGQISYKGAKCSELKDPGMVESVYFTIHTIKPSQVASFNSNKFNGK